jgi:putative transposase
LGIKEEEKMARKRFTPEQIIRTLREIEVGLSQGKSIKEMCREANVSDHTFYKWRKEYGNMTVDQARSFKGLEKENYRLKRLVADLSLDNSMLKEVARGNF